MTSEDINKSHYKPIGNWYILIWIISLTCLYWNNNSDLINLPYIFYLSILLMGVCLPIFLVGINPNRIKVFFSTPWLKFILIIFIYGFVLGYLLGGDLWRLDVECFIAMFVGLCLIILTPRDIKVWVCIFTILIILSMLLCIKTLALESAEAENAIYFGFRYAIGQAFGPTYIVITMLAPALTMLYFINGNKRFISITNLNFIIFISLLCLFIYLIYISMAIMQTRSLVFGLLLSISLAFSNVTSLYLAKHKSQNASKILLLLFIITLIIITFPSFSIFSSVAGSIDNFNYLGIAAFFDRVSDLTGNQFFIYDPRMDEAEAVLNALPIEGHLFGLGFGGGGSELTYGRYSTILHIAILNPWLRYGIFGFIFFVFVILRIVIRYLKAIFRLSILNNSLRPSQLMSEQFIVIISSGVLSLVFMSCMSGGWLTLTFFCLGILWGIWGIISSGLLEISYEQSNV